MRQFLLFSLVVLMVMAAATASAQWSVGLRMVGTGNYFPYLPLMQAMSEDGIGLVTADAGLFGYKEFIVGYGTGAICFEGSFAYDKLGSTWDADVADYEIHIDEEENLSWWYFGGSFFYHFMQGEGYAASVGLRYQYGSSEMTFTDNLDDDEVTISGSTSQFSVPIRFMWRPGDGKFAIGPEIAFKYTTGTTEYEETWSDRGSLSLDGPEYTGFDTEYSLLMKFMF
jgi:hypothetical protein